MVCKTKLTVKISLVVALLMTFTNFALFSIAKNNSKAKNYLFIDNGIDQPRRLLDMQNFEYLIPQSSCSKKFNNNVTEKPSIVTLIQSAPVNVKKRQALRDTWLHAVPKMLSFFVIGRTDSQPLQETIEKENDKYGDIIQGNFVDSYHNVTYKVGMLLKWFNTHCSDVKFLVKLDDDVFMNVPAVLRYLGENENQSVGGFYKKPEHVFRGQSKWEVAQEEWADEFYPETVGGASIIYSSQYARDAYEKALTSHFLWLEDIFYNGHIRMQLLVKITPLNDRILWPHQIEHSLLNGSTSLINSKSTFLFAWELKPELQYQIWNKINEK